MTVFQLVYAEYAERWESGTLPGFPLDQLFLALTRCGAVDETPLVREFRLSLAQVAQLFERFELHPPRLIADPTN